MEQKINDYFKQQYLTSGETRDNFIMQNCSQEFLEEAISLLSKENKDIRVCNIILSRENEKGIEETLFKCQKENHKYLFAREYFICKFMLCLVDEKDVEYRKLLETIIETIESGDYENAKAYYSLSPTPLDVAHTIKSCGKIELNIFLKDTENKYLQQAINNYISSREPFSIKVFATKRLPSFMDMAGNPIQSPHDFLTLEEKHFYTEEELDAQM